MIYHSITGEMKWISNFDYLCERDYYYAVMLFIFGTNIKPQIPYSTNILLSYKSIPK